MATDNIAVRRNERKCAGVGSDIKTVDRPLVKRRCSPVDLHSSKSHRISLANRILGGADRNGNRLILQNRHGNGVGNCRVSHITRGIGGKFTGNKVAIYRDIAHDWAVTPGYDAVNLPLIRRRRPSVDRCGIECN